MARKTFKATLERPPGTGTWTYLVVPFDVQKTFGAKGQLKVRGTINGVSFRSSLMPQGDGTHYLVVNKTIRDNIGASAGSTVRVTLERDTAPRSVNVAGDFRRALSRNREAKAAFEKMSYSHQKAYVEWIESAKYAETRTRRIGSAVVRIARGEHLKD